MSSHLTGSGRSGKDPESDAFVDDERNGGNANATMVCDTSEPVVKQLKAVEDECADVTENAKEAKQLSPSISDGNSSAYGEAEKRTPPPLQASVESFEPRDNKSCAAFPEGVVCAELPHGAELVHTSEVIDRMTKSSTTNDDGVLRLLEAVADDTGTETLDAIAVDIKSVKNSFTFAQTC